MSVDRYINFVLLVIYEKTRLAVPFLDEYVWHK